MIKNETVFVFWIKWLSTIGACGCAFASAMDLYPLNVWLGWAAGVGWAYIGWLWREPSIIIINIMMTVIYGGGILRSII
jgi:hypothetical protein